MKFYTAVGPPSGEVGYVGARKVPAQVDCNVQIRSFWRPLPDLLFVLGSHCCSHATRSHRCYSRPDDPVYLLF